MIFLSQITIFTRICCIHFTPSNHYFHFHPEAVILVRLHQFLQFQSQKTMNNHKFIRDLLLSLYPDNNYISFGVTAQSNYSLK